MTSTRSATATGTPNAKDRQDLESALTDAACMADVAFTLIGEGLGFEMKTPRSLTERETTLVYWIVSQTSHMIGLAEKAFHDLREG